jgi:hypothetical protein
MQGFLLAESGYAGLYTPSGSNYLTFGTNNTERMRIDSSGKLTYGGISYGVAVDPDGYGGFGSGYNFETNGGSPRHLVNGPVSGQYLSSGSSPFIAWYTATSSSAGTAATERMRIDSSGNLLVGKTSNDNSAVGVSIRPNEVSAVRDGGNPLLLNRLTSDGDIALFRKDGTNVGSIGTVDGDLNVFASASGHKGLRFGNGYIAPTSNSTSVQDATTDLGLSGSRFKDVWASGSLVGDNAYLSGGVYLGGTGSANKLDDYEEGTFQATLSAATSGTITISSTADTLAYVKVGRLVTITGMVSIVSTGSAVGDFVLLNNLPFTSADRDEFSGRNGGAVTFNDNSAGTKTTKAILMLESSTQIRIYVDASTVGGSDDFYLSFSYQATA